MDLHEGDGEVEALPQPLEGDEGLWGEAPGGHLTVGPLIFSWWALALESPNQQIDAGASILTHTWGTAAGAGVHLAVLSWKGRRRHQGRQHATQTAEGTRKTWASAKASVLFNLCTRFHQQTMYKSATPRE